MTRCGAGPRPAWTKCSAVREIRRCVDVPGFKAIRILPWLWELPLTDRRFYPVYAARCEPGAPFCTQIGHWPAHAGSNCPIIAPQKALEGLEALGLDEAVKARFLGSNAQRVFNI